MHTTDLALGICENYPPADACQLRIPPVRDVTHPHAPSAGNVEAIVRASVSRGSLVDHAAYC
jgi:hypothetical protein